MAAVCPFGGSSRTSNKADSQTGLIPTTQGQRVATNATDIAVGAELACLREVPRAEVSESDGGTSPTQSAAERYSQCPYKEDAVSLNGPVDILLHSKDAGAEPYNCQRRNFQEATDALFFSKGFASHVLDTWREQLGGSGLDAWARKEAKRPTRAYQKECRQGGWPTRGQEIDVYLRALPRTRWGRTQLPKTVVDATNEILEKNPLVIVAWSIFELCSQDWLHTIISHLQTSGKNSKELEEMLVQFSRNDNFASHLATLMILTAFKNGDLDTYVQTGEVPVISGENMAEAFRISIRAGVFHSHVPVDRPGQSSQMFKCPAATYLTQIGGRVIPTIYQALQAEHEQGSPRIAEIIAGMTPR
jgi:hypothetical protein